MSVDPEIYLVLAVTTKKRDDILFLLERWENWEG